MADVELSVEGPEFAEKVRSAEQVIQKLEKNQWNFEAVPELFGRRAAADVLAKEIVVIHDGRLLTRIGKLVTVGLGRTFNLLGPLPPTAHIMPAQGSVIESIHDQLGVSGLGRFEELHKFGRPQKVEFYNTSIFYQMRDLIFWSVLHGSGSFPSALEHMARHFAAGNILQNWLYSPSRPSENIKEPAVMEASCLAVQFPTPVVEWMDRPLFGGLVKETLHVEYLLTPEPSKVSHPYLELVGEGYVALRSQKYYLRHFAGVAPKDGLRGPNIPPEKAD